MMLFSILALFPSTTIPDAEFELIVKLLMDTLSQTILNTLFPDLPFKIVFELDEMLNALLTVNETSL